MTTGCFKTRSQWLAYLEDLLGAEGSEQKAKAFAEYLEKEHDLTFEKASDDTEITEEMYLKSFRYIDSCSKS